MREEEATLRHVVRVYGAGRGGSASVRLRVAAADAGAYSRNKEARGAGASMSAVLAHITEQRVEASAPRRGYPEVVRFLLRENEARAEGRGTLHVHRLLGVMGSRGRASWAAQRACVEWNGCTDMRAARAAPTLRGAGGTLGTPATRCTTTTRRPRRRASAGSGDADRGRRVQPWPWGAYFLREPISMDSMPSSGLRDTISVRLRANRTRKSASERLWSAKYQ